MFTPMDIQPLCREATRVILTKPNAILTKQGVVHPLPYPIRHSETQEKDKPNDSFHTRTRDVASHASGKSTKWFYIKASHGSI